MTGLESSTHFRPRRLLSDSESFEEAGLGPSRSRLVHLLRGPVAQALRFERAAVYVTGPTGGPRLVASSTELDAPDAAGPSPLREAAARGAHERGATPFILRSDRGETLVVPILRAGDWLGSLVVHRSSGAFTDEDLLQAGTGARLVARIISRR